jgi:ABC-type multidrug transport system ATPase subunit
MTAELSFVNVSVSRHDGSRVIRVLDRLSFELEPGQLIAVCGQRRSGKTTLVRTAAGLIPPDSGQVRLDGLDPWARSPLLSRAPKPRVALVSEDGGRRRWKRRRVIDLVRRRAPARTSGRSARSLAMRQLQELEVAHLAESPWRDLGLRERVLVALAEALTAQPRVLVTDNLSLALGMGERDLVGHCLRHAASTNEAAILMVTENVTDTLNAHKIALLGDGKLVMPDERMPGQAGTVLRLPSRERSA